MGRAQGSFTLEIFNILLSLSLKNIFYAESKAVYRTIRIKFNRPVI